MSICTLCVKDEEHERVEVLPAPGQQTGLRVDNDKRTTTPYMTKYERARVLGTRALQIASVGALRLSHKILVIGHCSVGKGATMFMPTTFPSAGQFSELFCCQT